MCWWERARFQVHVGTPYLANDLSLTADLVLDWCALFHESGADASKAFDFGLGTRPNQCAVT